MGMQMWEDVQTEIKYGLDQFVKQHSEENKNFVEETTKNSK